MNKQLIISEILKSGAKYVKTSISYESCSIDIAIRDINGVDDLPENFQWEEQTTGLNDGDY